MVGLQVLVLAIEVRILVPEQIKISAFCRYFYLLGDSMIRIPLSNKVYEIIIEYNKIYLLD